MIAGCADARPCRFVACVHRARVAVIANDRSAAHAAERRASLGAIAESAVVAPEIERGARAPIGGFIAFVEGAVDPVVAEDGRAASADAPSALLESVAEEAVITITRGLTGADAAADHRIAKVTWRAARGIRDRLAAPRGFDAAIDGALDAVGARGSRTADANAKATTFLAITKERVIAVEVARATRVARIACITCVVTCVTCIVTRVAGVMARVAGVITRIVTRVTGI